MAQGEGGGDPPAKHPTPPSSSSPRPISRSRLHNFQFLGWKTHRLLLCRNPGASSRAVKEVDVVAVAARSSNLRTRKAASSAPGKRNSPPPPPPPPSSSGIPPSSGNKEVVAAMVLAASARTRSAWKKAGLPKSLSSPSPSPATAEKGRSSRRLRSEVREKEEERPRFFLKLSKKEIEEDFLILTEKKPPRKPKKRPKSVEKQLDSVFPGYMLSEITTDSYKSVNKGTKW
ncbi:uncharacterized protein [Typha latifolia]|uniref:uncharacterized protein n=1 Tax=Typha latifolia TaxID=4733 RepID=UPI003C2DAF48